MQPTPLTSYEAIADAQPGGFWGTPMGTRVGDLEREVEALRAELNEELEGEA